MNRRDILKGMLALPVVGALGGCRHEHEHHPPYPPSGGGTLKVILQGPFAVVVPKKAGDEKDRKIRAFVPFDPERKHEFRFRTPLNVVDSENSQNHRQTHAFDLSDDGLEENERPPYIDHGFDDFKIDTGEWEPRRDNYFVFLELPMPSVISFIPPAEGVLFKNRRPGMMPVNHILEYRVRDLRRAHLRGRGESYLPLSCSDLYAEYDKYWKQSPDDTQEPALSQRPNLKEELTRCSNSEVSTFFFGVGLKKAGSPEEFSKIAGDHAVRFFNETLLPSFPNAPNLASKRLAAIGSYGQPCQSSGQATASPMMMPAVFRNSALTSRYEMVTSVEDCRAGGLIGLR